jgi:uncharacterized protein
MAATPDLPDTERGLVGCSVIPPPLPGKVTFEQRWADLTFVHWPVRPETVERLCPPGTRPDVFGDGLTYVSLIPFVLTSTRVSTALPVPYFGSFPETNVRIYTVDDAGRHGILFRSAESARLAAVPAIRIGLGVPYTWSRMRVTRSGDHITYDSVRRWPRRGLRSRLTVTIGDTVEPTPLEVWLTARWGAHPQRRPDLVGADRARAVALSRGPDRRAERSAGRCEHRATRRRAAARAVFAGCADPVRPPPCGPVNGRHGQEYPPSITMSEPVM